MAFTEKYEQYYRLGFFADVWLPYMGAIDVDALSKSLAESYKYFADARFKNDVDEAIEITKSQLRSSSRSYHLISKIWYELHSIKVADTLQDDVNLTLHFGLVRFALGENIETDAMKWVKLLMSQDKKERELVLVKCINSLAEWSHRSRIDSVLVTAAVLWCIHKDLLLLEYLEYVDAHSEVVDIIYASAVFRERYPVRSNKRLRRANSIVDGVIAGVSEADSTDVDMYIRIAYMLFHRWLFNDNVPFPFADDIARIDADSDGVDSDGKMAIDYALRAFSACDEHWDVRRVYALNQYLYYLVEISRESFDAAKAMEYTRILVGYKARSDMWNYRFDDTIARVYYRLAFVWEPTTAGSDSNLEEALKYARLAYEAAPNDRTVAALVGRIDAEIKRRAAEG